MLQSGIQRLFKQKIKNADNGFPMGPFGNDVPDEYHFYWMPFDFQ
jgi:hypothetical protein